MGQSRTECVRRAGGSHRLICEHSERPRSRMQRGRRDGGADADVPAGVRPLPLRGPCNRLLRVDGRERRQAAPAVLRHGPAGVRAAGDLGRVAYARRRRPTLLRRPDLRPQRRRPTVPRPHAGDPGPGRSAVVAFQRHNPQDLQGLLRPYPEGALLAFPDRAFRPR